MVSTGKIVAVSCVLFLLVIVIAIAIAFVTRRVGKRSGDESITDDDITYDDLSFKRDMDYDVRVSLEDVGGSAHVDNVISVYTDIILGKLFHGRHPSVYVRYTAWRTVAWTTVENADSLSEDDALLELFGIDKENEWSKDTEKYILDNKATIKRKLEKILDRFGTIDDVNRMIDDINELVKRNQKANTRFSCADIDKLLQKHKLAAKLYCYNSMRQCPPKGI